MATPATKAPARKSQVFKIRILVKTLRYPRCSNHSQSVYMLRVHHRISISSRATSKARLPLRTRTRLAAEIPAGIGPGGGSASLDRL